MKRALVLLSLAACRMTPETTGAVPAAAEAGLRITALVLCERVDGFREYEEARDTVFRAGDEILLYSEIDGFALGAEGSRVSLALRYTWELYDSAGRPVTPERWRSIADDVRTVRRAYRGPIRDYHQWFRFRLPEDFPAGAYRVRITVQDLTSGRSDSAGAAFSIGLD